jgi:hypothetical protein
LIHSKTGHGGGKSNKQKQAHAQQSKSSKAEDDIHFSRAQPIVPSGPVTLLTAPKAESSKAPSKPPQSPTLPKSPPNQAQDISGKGKGKGKPIPAGQHPTSPAKNQKGKGGKRVVSEGEAKHVVASEPSNEIKVESTPTKPSTSGKKKRGPAAPATSDGPSKSDKNEDAEAKDTSEKNESRSSGRGRGRGRGGGPPVVVVPKILTKIIAEGSNNPPARGAPRIGPTEKNTDTQPQVQASANASTTAAAVPPATNPPPVTSSEKNDAAETSEEALQKQSSSARGGDRGRRPFRGRGRGRGRGGRGGSDAGS